MKKLLSIQQAPAQHWVGDGFPVRTLFNYSSRDLPLSPFLMLDHAGPAEFSATEQRRGVGEHPHRGFETVTIVYSGEVAHRDSAGGGGVIGPGDVQWMTAGSGIVHDEFHSEAFASAGGSLEMAQLWVNLPAEHKMTAPSYQAITAADIPVLPLANEAGTLRVIAGQFADQAGAASTYSPLNVWDLQLNAGKPVELSVPEGHSLLLVSLHGQVHISIAADDEAAGDERLSNQLLAAQQVAVFSNAGQSVSLKAATDAKLLLLSGEPLNEPVVGYGPFVMNSAEQIHEAINDYKQGRFNSVTSRA